MNRPQLYLETSVWNFYFADDTPEKKEITLRFFDKIKEGEYEVFVSDVIIEEIGRATEEKKHLLLNLIKEYNPKRLIINEEVVVLAQKYISERIFPVEKIEDAIHAAVATIYEMDALISWNLKHLANLKKMELINGINMKEGYFKRLELITPMEVSDEEL
ncbi:MAG: PIN domain-containing protein [Candidatus Brocadiales bacterium]